jgi:hypothetical protein
MNGREYVFDYNRTHSLNALINFQATPKLSYSSTLRAMSGNPATLESTLQNYFTYDPLEHVISSYPLFMSNLKNNARLPMILELDIGAKKELRRGFGADLSDFLKADRSYLNVTVGNLLFFHRNVLWYFPIGQEKYIPVSINYIPYVNIGYIVKM